MLAQLMPLTKMSHVPFPALTFPARPPLFSPCSCSSDSSSPDVIPAYSSSIAGATDNAPCCRAQAAPFNVDDARAYFP